MRPGKQPRTIPDSPEVAKRCREVAQQLPPEPSFGPTLANSRQCCSSSAKVWPHLARIGGFGPQHLPHTPPTLVKLGQHLPDKGRTWSIWAQLRRSLIEIRAGVGQHGQTWAEICQSLANIGQHCPQNGPETDRSRVELGLPRQLESQCRTKVRHFSGNFGIGRHRPG